MFPKKGNMILKLIEKDRSRWAFMLGETGQYNLLNICDALVKLGINVTFGREQNYYRSLYANSDGTAGIKI